jgi:ubiquinone/menaquinone biosynthesis C-methylase UbiE
MNGLQYFTRPFTRTLPRPKVVEVRALFNAKSNTWNQKYESGGPLAFRVAAFEGLLSRRLFPNAEVLDLGCGTAAIASALAAHGFRVTACDIAEEMIQAGKRIYKESAIEWCLLSPDWKQLPFDSCTFNGIVASSVLEYLPDVNGVLIECQRILKSDGILIATVPNGRTMTRKLENLMRPAATVLDRLPGLNRIPRIHSYVTYLKCSCNRMSLDGWRAAGKRANFAEVEQIETGPQKGSLAFLVFRKAPTEARQWIV